MSQRPASSVGGRNTGGAQRVRSAGSRQGMPRRSTGSSKSARTSMTPWAHRPLPRAGRRQPRPGRVAPRAGPSHGLRGQATTEPVVHFCAAAPVHIPAAVDTASSSGKKYDFEIFGEPCSVDTLADVLVSVLLSIHKIDDNFLPRISRKSGRVRPILARDPQELYPGRHDLSHYSRKVADGWYVGTNYSKKDVALILGCICDVAGLVLGDDLSGPAIEDIKSHAQ